MHLRRLFKCTVIGCSLDLLEAVVPLVGQVRQGRAEVERSLAQIQSVLESVEVPVDGNVQRLRDELRTARVSKVHTTHCKCN